MKTQLIIIFFTITVFSCHSQVISTKSSIPNNSYNNQIDSLGQKTGLWIEDNGMQEIYFRFNKRHGVFKSYYSINGKLHCLGEYKEGDPIGTWYYFNERSELKFIEKNIERNKDLSIMDKSGEKRIPDFKSYLIWYFPEGTIKEEGIALYSESIEVDFIKYGIWRYYNKEGKLTETKEEH